MTDIHESVCLCGAASYRVTDEPCWAGICHCTFCQKSTGSAFAVAAYFGESSVRIKSGALRTYEYRSDESYRWLNLEFCSTCGTNCDMDNRIFPWIAGNCRRDLR
jgi:hypothetical protein